MSVASRAVQNKREREKNIGELCYTACPSCIDLDARDCEREREKCSHFFRWSLLPDTNVLRLQERELDSVYLRKSEINKRRTADAQLCLEEDCV